MCVNGLLVSGVRPTVDEMQSLRSFFLLIVKQLVIEVGVFVLDAD